MKLSIVAAALALVIAGNANAERTKTVEVLGSETKVTIHEHKDIQPALIELRSKISEVKSSPYLSDMILGDGEVDLDKLLDSAEAMAEQANLLSESEAQEAIWQVKSAASNLNRAIRHANDLRKDARSFAEERNAANVTDMEAVAFYLDGIRGWIATGPLDNSKTSLYHIQERSTLLEKVREARSTLVATIEKTGAEIDLDLSSVDSAIVTLSKNQEEGGAAYLASLEELMIGLNGDLKVEYAIQTKRQERRQKLNQKWKEADGFFGKLGAVTSDAIGSTVNGIEGLRQNKNEIDALQRTNDINSILEVVESGDFKELTPGQLESKKSAEARQRKRIQDAMDSADLKRGRY